MAASIVLVTCIAGSANATDGDLTARAHEPARRETFSVTYTVEIGAAHPAQARVRWELAGVDEVERLRLRFDPERFTQFEASGTLERRRGEILWSPNGPYAELRYVAHVDHRRAADKGFDSYAGDGWIIARTSDFFPRSAALFRRDVEPHPESRARLVVRLPEAWESATVLPPDGPHRWVVETPHQRLDHPRGWLFLGHGRLVQRIIAGTAVIIALPRGVSRRPEPILDLLQSALPSLRTLFDRPLQRLLVAIGPDPMWRGGLSGEESFYIHADRALRSPDRTSPYLHELFHVAAPFRPNADAHWVTEGLAEYYSIELPRRSGELSDADFRRALQLFMTHGVWHRDFTETSLPGLRNNSAPLVMHALDRRIRRVTHGARSLDDAVTALAREGGVVSTARFLGAVERSAGKSFAGFFRRHVYRGEPPALASAPR